MRSSWDALGAVVVAVVLSGLALAVVVGDHRLQGPVVLRLTAEHGLHLGDAAVGVAWVVCVVLLALLARAPRVRAPHRPSR